MILVSGFGGMRGKMKWGPTQMDEREYVALKFE